ncbi:Rrf2 family transcriptional regulator [Ponticaulis sp.]|uniref:Rrf2 family transcriptional regulator n=1 Tax=Ponticaulis sp. TaxID=2020902 RepID=UPI000B68CC98|nr:Rrf2 family transcriptional regulator [Ponticaulis sp.]MAI89540.1 Rrf2 family transcriptional regulator [Ponticaulis sp.]OUY00572.1 MAG: Rrf2 family transcriptional regulator [Hyphomonadaceae bacterium TMED5]|tara:strand:+ start:6486 stop:6944 length:459 start_codon:yes stop_codon:yes gene_type:complete
MKLGTKGRYAVMALVDLANSPVDQPKTLAEIAENQSISLSYLEQLFAKMRRRGVVKSVRGPGGGYVLAKTANKTRLSDIILAVDEPIKTTRCSPDTGRGCQPDGSKCATHELWDALRQHILGFLAQVSLEDVVEGRAGQIVQMRRLDGNQAA